MPCHSHEQSRVELAEEVARLTADPEDWAAREAVSADMDAVAADWPVPNAA